jgi:hypothetical protein
MNIRSASLLIVVFCLMAAPVFAQKGKEAVVSDNARRRLTKTEVKFMGSRMDSIRRNLDRMIRFEKELRQKNYYLNEKTQLMDELLGIIKNLQQSLDVVDVTTSDINNIFGKPSHKSPVSRIYEIETYKSNCPFIQINFTVRKHEVTRLEYTITDCQRWK